MRRAILSVVFVGLTATLAAQTPGPSIRETASADGRPSIFSKTIDTNDTTITYTGLVLVMRDGTKVSADDAIMNRQTGVLELSGHVTLTLPK